MNTSHPDDDLERRIDQQTELLREDRSPDENRATWLELAKLHAMRSPERIKQMEIEQRLLSDGSRG